MQAPTGCIVLHIPCLPDLDLSANRRRSRHFMQQARDTVAERLNAALMLTQAKQVAWEDANPGIARSLFALKDWEILPIPVDLHWKLYWPKGIRARDADGCADLLKPWQDAMIDLGWLENDSPKYVRRVSYESVPSSPQGPGMTLTIKQAEGV